MLRLIRQFWDAVLFGGGLLGLIYVPADLYGLPETYPWLREVRSVVDRFDLVIGFATLCVIYILWMDVRPYYRRWRARKQKPAIECLPGILCESSPIDMHDDGPDLFANSYYLGVVNNSPDGRVLRNVSVEFRYSDIYPLRTKLEGATSKNLQSGNIAYFLLGKIVHTEVYGVFRLPALEGGPSVRAYRHNIPQGFLSFEIASDEGVRGHSLGYDLGKDRGHIWPAVVVITAEDVPPRYLHLTIDMGELKRPVQWSDDRPSSTASHVRLGRSKSGAKSRP